MLIGNADTPAVAIEFMPGSKVEPSAGGYCVLQQLLTDVAGKPFPELAREYVLVPAAMQESTFDQTLPQEWEAAAAVGHLAEQQPLARRWENYSPMNAAAGLWTTPADLARLVAALSQVNQTKLNSLLASAQVTEMFTAQIEDMGLGAAVTGKGKALAFSARGASAGYASYVIGFPATGQGAVLMTNSDTGDKLIKELVDFLRLEYGWPE